MHWCRVKGEGRPEPMQWQEQLSFIHMKRDESVPEVTLSTFEGGNSMEENGISSILLEPPYVSQRHTFLLAALETKE